MLHENNIGIPQPCACKPIIAAVLRSGGVYTPDYANALFRAISWHYDRQFEFFLLSDLPATAFLIKNDDFHVITLKYDEWEGWWSKMELYRPDLPFGDCLYIDLDTAIVGDVGEVLQVQELTVLRDFYFPNQIGSGIMYLTKEARHKIWQTWMRQPTEYMAQFKRGGDQAFLYMLPEFQGARRWQHTLPDQIFSYKAENSEHPARQIGRQGYFCKEKTPDNARIIAFHGRPKPHEIQDGWVKEYWDTFSK